MKTKTFKQCAGALMVAALLAGGAVVAQASPAEHGGHGGWHGGPAYEQLKPEQQAKYDATFKSFQDAMNPLAEKMMAKRLELDALSGNTAADPKRITALAEEIATLRTQMRAERIKLDEKLEKEVGINLPARYDGRGDGRGGHNGMRNRDGRGMHNSNCSYGSNCTF